ncbi:hypothetical protein ACFLXQ_02895 [Chloroflexota bacterium]
MSCNTNSQNVGRLAAIKCGVSTAAGKASYVAGTIAGGVARASDTVNHTVGASMAPVSNRVLAAVDRPAVAVAKLAPALAMVAATTRFQVRASTGSNQMPALGAAVTFRNPQELVQNARGVMKTTKKIKSGLAIGAVAASTVAGLSLEEKTQELVQERRSGLFFKAKVKVEFSKSRLTGLLNRLDLSGTHRLGQNIVSSEGELVSARGKAWHRGTVVFKTPPGERTMTHLQRMSLPATHYYFDRSLTDEETAGIVSSQPGFKPQQMAGYVGEINAMEGLAPTWAQTKRAMIRTRLYFPPQPQGWAKTETEKTGAATNQVPARRAKPVTRPKKVRPRPVKETSR